MRVPGGRRCGNNPLFLGVKVGETEFEKWRVGCVCKSFPLRFF